MQKSIAAFTLVLILVFPLSSMAQNTATLHGKINDSKGSPLPGANIVLVESSQGTATDREGNYRIEHIEPGTYTVKVSFVGYKTINKKVSLEAGQVLERNYTLKVGGVMGSEVTVVVGSRANHTAADELAVPVDVFTPEQISSLGTSETSQILEQLAPSVNFPHQTVADGTDAVRPFTLRGLSPDHTLVLINGKRRHPTALVHRLGSGIQEGSSGVDLNAIPSNAIGRMEVLRDGAAAQYGSDAIAGVVNVVLKNGAIPPRFTARLGGYTPDKYDPDGTIYDFTGEYGIPLSDKGFFNVFAELRHRDPTNRAGADPRDQIVDGDADVVQGGEVIQKNNPVSQPNHHWGDGESENAYVWWNGEYMLDENTNTKLYSFGGYSHRSSLSQGFYRRGMDGRNWPAIYPEGFLPNFDTPVIDYSTSLGLKGQLGEWNYDLNSVYGYNKFEFNITNSLNTSYGPDIPPNKTSFYAGSEALKQWTNTLDFYRSVDIGLAKPLSIAVGANFRYEDYMLEAGEPKSYNDGGFDNQYGDDAASGAQVFPGFTPTSQLERSRTNIGIYTDLESNLTEEFLVNVAGRFESYSDFGETLIGKLALRYQPVKELILRSAISTGFRAPSLSQQYFSKVSTIFGTDPDTGDLVPYEVGLFRTDSDVAKALGAQSLQDEKSVNISGGMAITPVTNLTFTADYYFVRINDRIILSGTLSGPQVEALVEPYGAQRAQYFSNAIDTRTQGIDLTANYRTIIGGGTQLNFTGSFNYNKTDIIGQVDNPPELDGLEEQIFGLEARTKLTREHPETKTRITVRLDKNQFDAKVSATRYGEVVDADDTPEQIQTLSPKVLFDAEVGYQVIDQVKLSLGVNNIFDAYPDKTIEQNNFNGIFPYPRSSPFGFNGRFIYSKMVVEI